MIDGPRRILVIAPQPFYQDRGTPIALLHTVRAMVRAGFDVDVATFDGGVDPGETGVRVFQANSRWSSPNLPIGLSWRKVMQHFGLYRLARKLLQEHRYDAIHAVEESVFASRLLARRFGTPIAYDMHSWLSDELSTLPALGRWPARPMIRAIERHFVSGVDAIFCSAGLAAIANSLHEAGNATEWLFPVQQQPIDASRKAVIRSARGIGTESELVVYAGNLSTNQNIALLIEAASSLLARRDTVEIAIIGALDKEMLLHDTNAALRARIHLIERLPRVAALELMASADAAISLRVRGLNAPLKLFDYIGAGIPVVATDVLAHRTVLDTAAVYCRPEAKDVASAIERLLDDRDRYEEIRRTYAELAAHDLSTHTFDLTLANVYSRICDGQPLSLQVV